jgi:uncharacterized phage-associated protein
MATSAKAIANYFLELARKERKALNPMQIQKLVYFAHGWYLALFGQPLVQEDIQAWSYGPVIPSLYGEFKKFGNGPINEEATESRFEGMIFKVVKPSIRDIPDVQERTRIEAFLDRVWKVYSPFSAIQLSNMTHQEDSPWKIALEQSGGGRGTIIQNNLIREYFLKQVQKPANA